MITLPNLNIGCINVMAICCGWLGLFIPFTGSKDTAAYVSLLGFMSWVADAMSRRKLKASRRFQ